jgi:hypothetical protein
MGGRHGSIRFKPRNGESVIQEQMSSADAAWLHMDSPTNLMVVNAVLWFDEPLDWQRVKEQLRRRLVAEFPRFRQRVVESWLPLAGPWWEDDPRFDLVVCLANS